jgi:hypothetical protein
MVNAWSLPLLTVTAPDGVMEPFEPQEAVMVWVTMALIVNVASDELIEL